MPALAHSATGMSPQPGGGPRSLLLLGHQIIVKPAAPPAARRATLSPKAAAPTATSRCHPLTALGGGE